jgi:hypothetical protein
MILKRRRIFIKKGRLKYQDIINNNVESVTVILDLSSVVHNKSFIDINMK